MPSFPGIKFFIEPAEVFATYTDKRVVDIKWLGMEGIRRDVIVVNDPGNSSMPKPGDRGLVIGNGNYFYFLGKIEFGYAAKVNGTYVNPDTGKNETAREVADGEVYVTNTSTKSWLSMPNSGDMSLLNGFMEGFKYFSNLRFGQVIGKTVGLFANGVNFALGTTIRNIPGVGDQPVVGTNGGKAIEVLLQVAYQSIQTVRMHLGDVTDLVTGLVPQLSAWGARLKALLEVTAGPVTLGSIGIDEIGDIEANSTTGSIKASATIGSVDIQGTTGVSMGVPAVPVKTGSVVIDAGGNVSATSITGSVGITSASVVNVISPSILLGGPAAIHPVAWGDILMVYLTMLSLHYHTALGPLPGGGAVWDPPPPLPPAPGTPVPLPVGIFSLTTMTS